MIYFKDSYFNMAKELIDSSHEFLDTKKDLEKIEIKMQQIEMAYGGQMFNPDIQKILNQAQDLNNSLRRKYPTINAIIKIADRLPRRLGAYGNSNNVLKPVEYEMLRQDKCGILCHVVLKKEITGTIEEIIDHVE